jgi:hypothetical protein
MALMQAQAQVALALLRRIKVVTSVGERDCVVAKSREEPVKWTYRSIKQKASIKSK